MLGSRTACGSGHKLHVPGYNMVRECVRFARVFFDMAAANAAMVFCCDFCPCCIHRDEWQHFKRHRDGLDMFEHFHAMGEGVVGAFRSDGVE